jgi:O-antigen/teichoic acid export membrane protein
LSDVNAKKLAIYLAPFFINAGLRVVGIPLTTYVLNPREFGLFALMMGVIAICTVLASSVTGYVVNHHFRPGETAPPRLLATVAGVEIAIGLFLALICFAGWPIFSAWMGISGDLSPFSFLALLLSVPVGALWTSGSMVMIFDGLAKLYTGTLMVQAVAQLLATLVSLYVMDWRVGALVAGQIAGIAVCAIGGSIGMKRHFSLGVDRHVVRESFSLMPLAMASGLANSGTDLMERVVLGRVSGTTELGLYVHSQSYRSMLGTAGKAFVQVLQPAMMREARSPEKDFSETRAGWNLVYALFTGIGLVFSLVGEEIVSLLTHDKFTSAAVFIPFWCVFLTFQYLGRPQTATLYANGQGKTISSALLVGNIVSGILMIALGIPFHAFGLVAAVLTGELVNRAILQYWTFRLWQLPFQDTAAIGGSVLVILTDVVFAIWPLPLVWRLLLLVIALAMIAVAIWRSALKFLFDQKSALQAIP